METFHKKLSGLIASRQYRDALDLIKTDSNGIRGKSIQQLRTRLIALVNSSTAQTKNDQLNTTVASVNAVVTGNVVQYAGEEKQSEILKNPQFTETEGRIEGWTREFSEGKVCFIQLDNGNAVEISLNRGRDYLSQEMQLLPLHEYRITLDCGSISGNPGEILAVISSQPLDGNLTIYGLQFKKDKRSSIVFATGAVPLTVRLRVGVGTTAPCATTGGVTFNAIHCTRRKRPFNNRKLIADDLWSYIDPELQLPTVVGVGNDYSGIEEKLHALLNGKSWQKLSVSIIVPAYGRFALLRNTLAAICIQSYPKHLIEVVVVDDGSKEDLSSVFFEFADKINLYWLKQKRDGYGLARARNLGARAARGEVVLFLDSDILLPRLFLERLMSYHHVEKKVSVLGIRQFVRAEDYSPDAILSKPGCLERPIRTKSKNPHFSSYVDENNATYDWRLDAFDKNRWLKDSGDPFRYFGGGHSSVTKEQYLAVGGIDETFKKWGNEDQEFAYRLQMVGQYFIPLREILDLHQEEPNDGSNFEYKLEQNKVTHKLLVERCPHFTVRPYRKGRAYRVPRFSIYIPAFNTEEFVGQAIESVLAQTITDFEIVVVDDSSTDNTWSLLNAKYGENEKIRLFRKEHGGIASASNFALRQCNGYIVAQLDSDDLLKPNALAELADYFEKNSGIDCVYTAYELIDSNGSLRGAGWSALVFNPYEMLVGMSVPHLRAFRRFVYYRTNGFDETLENAVDYDFYLKVSRVSSIGHIPKVLYSYRIHGSQTSTAKRLIQAKNHVVAVNRFLERIGLDNCHAEKINPCELHRNYICRVNGEFGEQAKAITYRQNALPEKLLLKQTKRPGNDYSEMQNHVVSFYKDAAPKYSQCVSIVIPVYNRAERLSRCLAGIYHQSYPRELMELIVVDDGSSDEVISVIRKYGKIFNLKYAKQADVGYRLSAARNLGIRLATHENISIIDCDLIPLPGFIESFMQYLHHFDNVVLLGHQRFVDPTGVTDDEILRDVKVLETFKDIVSENSTMRTKEMNAGPTEDWRYSLYRETNYLKEDEYPYRAFSSGHVAYKKKAIESAGYYDEEFNIWGCEDNEAGYRLYNKGYVFIPVLDAVDLHQEPPGGKNETDREGDRLKSRDLLESKCPPMRGWFGKAYKAKRGDTPLVSICVPAFNTKDYVVEAIESALSQTCQDIEVIVYDDFSDDGTYELIREKYGSLAHVRLYRGTHRRNVTYARNFLTNVSRGEFVGFLDSDDVLESTCIEACLKEFRGHPNVGLVTTRYTRMDAEGNHIGDGWWPQTADRRALFTGNIFTHFRMFRIRDWNRSAKWTDNEIEKLYYGEDWDLCLKLIEVADFARIPNSLYRYRVRTGSITRAHKNAALAEQHVSIAKNLLKRQGITEMEVFSTYPETDPHLLCYYPMF